MNDTQASLRAALALALTPGLGPRKFKLLLEHFGSAARVFEADAPALGEVEGVGPKLIHAIGQAKDSGAPDKELERAARLGVTLLPLSHADYPESLRAIYDPPPILYVRGKLPDTLLAPTQAVRAVGIVGTRDASSYALEFSHTLAARLSESGVTVVSGLALGVDSAAHEGAVNVGGGTTVAVLGSGVDVVYPRQNVGLARRILDGHGALVSEYPIGTGPRAGHFPGRNRIISGLSRGVVVVEAGEKSGALITADYALEEGRTVFAVPGRVGDHKAKGTLNLLKQGAVLAAGVDDVLGEFGWTGAQEHAAPTPALTDTQKLVVEAVRAGDTPLLDDLIVRTGLGAPELLPVLMLLELQGVVKPVPGGRYRYSFG